MRYRRERVAALVREVVGEAIARRISDPRVSPLTTVTRVKVSGDLLNATVYLTVAGDETSERRSVDGMRHAAGYVQRMLAQQLGMRHCPELRFEVDEGLKKVKHTLDLIRENRESRPDLFPPEAWEKADRSDAVAEPEGAIEDREEEREE